MQWSLELMDGPRNGTDIDPATVTPVGEFLCGRCGALLAVDHQIWSNSDLVGNAITCLVCEARSNPLRGHLEG